jgi:hypothetical protein
VEDSGELGMAALGVPGNQFSSLPLATGLDLLV